MMRMVGLVKMKHDIDLEQERGFTLVEVAVVITILALGTCLIFLFLLSEMGLLVQIATVLSFMTAPFYAILNYRLITSKHMPIIDRPSEKIKILSILGIIFLAGFTGVYLLSL